VGISETGRGFGDNFDSLMTLRHLLKVSCALLLGVAGVRSEPQPKPQGPIDVSFRTDFIRVDFDGDRKADTLVGAPGILASRYEAELSLSDGKRQQFSFGFNGSWLVSMRAQDIDSDGDTDIVLTRFGSPILILVNDGRGQFDSALVTAYPPLCRAATTINISTFTGHAVAADESDAPQPGTLSRSFDYTLARFSKLRPDSLANPRAIWSLGRSSRSPPQDHTAV